jgi:hypothetical protein
MVVLTIACLTWAAQDTGWAFTTVVPSRICADERTGGCLSRIAARVVAADGSRFFVSYDDAHHTREVTVVEGPAPRVGAHVVLAEWKGRRVLFSGGLAWMIARLNAARARAR